MVRKHPPPLHLPLRGALVQVQVVPCVVDAVLLGVVGRCHGLEVVLLSVEVVAVGGLLGGVAPDDFVEGISLLVRLLSGGLDVLPSLLELLERDELGQESGWWSLAGLSHPLVLVLQS